MIRPARIWPAMICVAAILQGCAETNYGPLEGTVKVNGEPLGGAQVMFHPRNDAPAANAKTDAQGQFRIESLNPVETGKYAVTVSCPLLPDGNPVPANVKPSEVNAQETIPANYLAPATTPLEFDLTANNRSFDVKVTKNK